MLWISKWYAQNGARFLDFPFSVYLLCQCHTKDESFLCDWFMHINIKQSLWMIDHNTIYNPSGIKIKEAIGTL